MAAKDADIRSFVIQAAKDEGRGVDIKEGMSSFAFYENIMSNHLTALVKVTDSGNSIEKDGKRVSIMEGLPIRGGEEIRFDIEDSNKNKLKGELYLNKMMDGAQSTKSDSFTIQCVSKESFTNEMTRVTKRYEGKISENVTKILQEIMEADFKPENIEETSNTYNFIGNDRKPFYVCTWLATKGIPTENVGKTGGFFLYQTQDGMNFKSVDNLLDQDVKKKYVSNDSDALPEGYDDKILNYDMLILDLTYLWVLIIIGHSTLIPINLSILTKILISQSRRVSNTLVDQRMTLILSTQSSQNLLLD